MKVFKGPLLILGSSFCNREDSVQEVSSETAQRHQLI